MVNTIQLRIAYNMYPTHELNIFSFILYMRCVCFKCILFIWLFIWKWMSKKIICGVLCFNLQTSQVDETGNEDAIEARQVVCMTYNSNCLHHYSETMCVCYQWKRSLVN